MKNEKQQDELRKKMAQKILSLPLVFDYLAVDVISKEFTKLKHFHPYRIQYLGPRFENTLILHKKYSRVGPSRGYSVDEILGYERYEISINKIVKQNSMQKSRRHQHHKSGTYYRAFQGMNPSLDLSQQYQFNSCFEGGNLDCVVKIKANQFDLFLRIDSNTRGHLQWFYFSIKNGVKMDKVILHLCNLSKSGTLYENNMKPFIFSTKKYEREGKEWQQAECRCYYSKQALRYDIIYQRIPNVQLGNLTIQYEFSFQHDEVFFAYCIPYSYSRLLKQLTILPKQWVTLSNLGRSLMGVDIPLVNITNQSKQQNKKNVLITARIHPSQSNSSYVLSGFINFLCSGDKLAVELRNRINFWIVPMVNPDGVILGNTRSSTAGKDLNRQYNTNNQQIFPEVCLIKRLAYNIQKNNGLMFYFDFHGHSCKKNTFFYGPNYSISQNEYYQCRILPKIIEKLNNSFRYYSCSFSLAQKKKSTARGVFLQKYKIPYTYTIESSVGLYYDSQQKMTYRYDRPAWELIGANICEGFSLYIISMEEFQQVIKEKRIERNKIKEKRQQKKLINNIHFKKSLDQQAKVRKNEMWEMIEDIKCNGTFEKINEDDLSSDDHNSDEDIQNQKFKQFTNLVSESNHKQIKLQITEQLHQKNINGIKNVVDPISFISSFPIAQKQLTDQRSTNVFERIIKANCQKNSTTKFDQFLGVKNCCYHDKKINNAIKKQILCKNSFARSSQAKMNKQQHQKRCLIHPQQYQSYYEFQKIPQKGKILRNTMKERRFNNFGSNIVVVQNTQTASPIRRYSNFIGNYPRFDKSNSNNKKKISVDNSITKRISINTNSQMRRKLRVNRKQIGDFMRNFSDISNQMRKKHGQIEQNISSMDIDNMAMTIRTFNSRI